jgi:hypothetical protein
MESLRYQQPQYHQRHVNTVVVQNAGVSQRLVEKDFWKEFLET